MIINKLLSTTPQISSTHNLLVNKHTTIWGGTIDFFPMKTHLKSWDSEGRFPHDPGGRIICQVIKYLQKFFAIYNAYIYMISFYIQETSYMKWEVNTA